MPEFLAPFVAAVIMFGLAAIAFHLLEPWLSRGLQSQWDDFDSLFEPIFDGYRKHLAAKAKRIAKKQKEVDRA
jgi:hypothetical protein